jgi:hypothetical protein
LLTEQTSKYSVMLFIVFLLCVCCWCVSVVWKAIEKQQKQTRKRQRETTGTHKGRLNSCYTKRRNVLFSVCWVD